MLIAKASRIPGLEKFPALLGFEVLMRVECSAQAPLFIR